VLLVAALAAVPQSDLGHLRQPERLIEFAVGEQTGVGRDLAAQEFQLQAAIKTDPQILVLAVTNSVPLSAWDDLAEISCFSRVWRKSCANAREVIWEMWVETHSSLRSSAYSAVSSLGYFFF
jgi:hypothetical protein